MTDHLEIVITRGNHHQSRINLSKMNHNSLEDKGTDAASSNDENHASTNGSPCEVCEVPVPSSPPESRDHENDQSLDDIFSETVSIENSSFIDRFNARKQQLLMRLEEQQGLGMRNEEGSTAGQELQLLKDSQLEKLENIQISIKVRLCFYLAMKKWAR